MLKYGKMMAEMDSTNIPMMKNNRWNCFHFTRCGYHGITVSFHLTESWRRHVFCLYLVGPRVQAAAGTDRAVSWNMRSLGKP